MKARSGRPAHEFGADPIVVAYGMGVDSTAMLIGLRDRRVPIDLILFADTGSEKRETMAYLPIIQSWLAANGLPPVTVIKRDSPRAEIRRSTRNACASGFCRRSLMADIRAR